MAWEDRLSRDYFSEFRGQSAIVAGGASGIGAALAEALHWLGAKVAVLDKSATLPARIAKTRGVSLVSADLSIETERRLAIREAVRASGRPKYFISTIGFDKRIDFGKLTQGEAELLMRVNFYAPLFAARDIMPAMRKAGGGAICLFTSRHGSEIFEPDMLGYGCAKAALDGGIRRLGVHAGGGNTAKNIIRVFGYCPGWVQTGNQKARFSGKVFRAAAAEQLVPLGMTPEDIVPSVIFGLSRHAGLLSGATLRFDGGEGQIKKGAVNAGGRKKP